jgi:hypothetical protein
MVVLAVLPFGSGTVAPATASTTGRTSLNVPRDYPAIHAALDAGRTRATIHPVEEPMTRSTRNQVLGSQRTMFPSTHPSPAEPKPPGNRHQGPQGETMHAAKDDLPIGMEIPSILTRREAQWGDLSVAVANIAIHDATEFFASKLPDGRCPCPHWGYVIKGRLRVKYADHEEVLSAGEVYYLAPGHIPVVEEPLEIVEFSPLADYKKTTAALMA